MDIATIPGLATKALTRQEALLDVHDLCKDFGGLRAVNKCSFTVAKGSITALIGPNGAGKTTVFNLITGLLKPTSGSVAYAGKDITGRLPHQIVRLGVSRTFQRSRELMEMTVLENVVLHTPLQGFRRLFDKRITPQEREKAMT